MHLALIGGQLDGKLTLVVSQYQFVAAVEVFFEDDTAIIGIANAHLLTEQLQTAEERCLVVVNTGNEFGVDNVHAPYSTNEYQAIGGNRYRALIIWALLQSVLAAETANGEGPVALFILLGHYV